jgi:hypothetical protein
MLNLFSKRGMCVAVCVRVHAKNCTSVLFAPILFVYLADDRYKEGDDLEDSINMSILTLKEAFEGEMDENNVGQSNQFFFFLACDSFFLLFVMCTPHSLHISVEIGIINEETKQFKILQPSEIKDYLNEIAN